MGACQSENYVDTQGADNGASNAMDRYYGTDAINRTPVSSPQTSAAAAMELLNAAKDGNTQACWMYTVFFHAIHTTQPVNLYYSVRSISFHQPQLTNITRLTLPRPATNTLKQNSPVLWLMQDLWTCSALTSSH